MLPRVKIYFENGLLGSTSPSDDAVVGLVASAVAVVGKFDLAKAYLITSLDGLTALGITSGIADANANIYKVVSEFYMEAPAGTKLWILGSLASVTMADLCDVTKTHAKTLVDSANGAINFLMIAKNDPTAYVPVVLNGMESDVYAAMTNAQALGEYAANTKFAPLFTILPAWHYTGIAADLTDLTKDTSNRVCILVGDSVQSSNTAAVGLLAGRLASIPVQRSIARVKSGALPVSSLYIGSNPAESGDPDVINDFGYITFRTFVGKANYYFTDDKLATISTDDYALIPRRRTIDKAYRIGYQTLVNELSDEIPVNDNGQIPASVAKSIQNTVEVAIEKNMTSNGNLGVDPSDSKDTGVSCYIDYTQDIVSTSKLGVTLRVKPYGYPKYIDLYLGFKTTATA